MNDWLLLRYRIEGIRPEGVLFHFQRAQIPVYSVQKADKNALELCVERKYRKKVFTIADHSCYNITRVSSFGLFRLLKGVSLRIGFLIGCALFACICALSSYPVLRIDVVGTGKYYRREITALLAKNGVTVGKGYDAKQAPKLTAQILSFEGVTFCSLKKRGNILRVEVQANPVAALCERGKDLISTATGEVYSLTVLRGIPRVMTGEKVKKGDVLVSAEENGEKIIAMASARILFRLYGEGKDEDEALAQCLLEAEDRGAEVLSSLVTEDAQGFSAEITCLVTVSVNMD